MIKTVTLYRTVGPAEAKLIEASGWRSFPPRLPEQPIFYPVTNEAYAIQIARDWNVPASGSGYATHFTVNEAYVSRFPKKVVGNKTHEELWGPADELEAFNAHILGPIEVIHSFEK
ncbi:MAG: hypothetical protein QM760_20285 [Nibricoccus sp.]